MQQLQMVSPSHLDTLVLTWLRLPCCRHGDGNCFGFFLQTEAEEAKREQRTPAKEEQTEQRLVSQLDQNLDQEHPHTLRDRQADHRVPPVGL